MSKFFIINTGTISEFFPIGVPVTLSATGIDMSAIEDNDVLIGYNNLKNQFHCHYQAVIDDASVKLVKQLDKVHGVVLKDIPGFPSKYLSSIMSPISICEIDEALGIKLLKGLYSARCPIEATNKPITKHITLLDVYKSLDINKREDVFQNFIRSKGVNDGTIKIYLNNIQPDCFNDILEKHEKNIFNVVDLETCNDLKDTIPDRDEPIFFAGKRNKNMGFTLTAINYYIDFLEYIKKTNCSKTLQQIIFGAPGTGKSYSINQIIGDNVKVNIYGVEVYGLPKEMDSDKYIIPDNMLFRTTFHPEYDYAQFVGCYKPIVADEDGKEVTYQFVPQVFTDAYVEAWNNPDKPVFLVIEEINRGNCAQIFGDIFQLLDRDEYGKSEYSIRSDKDLQKYLSRKLTIDDPNVKENVRNGEALLLPKNFNIIATMNTSDQSLYPMDSAFKRRWDWKYTPTISDAPNSKSKEFKIYLGDNKDSDYCYWHEFVKEVNKRIKDATKSEDKQLGEYFIKKDVYIEEFISKVMFYLWTDICKENYTTKDNFFRTKKDDSNSTDEFTFNELVSQREKDGKTHFPKDKRLQQFMKYLDVDVKNDTKP